MLDDNFIPTVLHAAAASRLASFTTELLGLLHQRGDALGGRVAATGRGAAAEFADFLMLQTINRYEPLFRALRRVRRAAPGGSLSPVRVGRPASWRRSPPTPSGRRNFPPTATITCANRSNRWSRRCAHRSAWCWIRTRSRFRSKPKKFGISVAIVTDTNLLRHGRVRPRRARRRADRRTATPFPVATEDRSGRKDSRPGDAAVARGAGAPASGRAAADSVSRRVCLFRARSDRTELWDQLKTSGGIAVARGGEFPGLSMEFWAIRS